MWMLSLDDVEPAALEPSVLDDEERRRAARIGAPARRLSFVAGRLLLRELLGEELAVAPRDIAYTRERCPACGAGHGRPALSGRHRGALHFSLSRRDDLVLVGLASVPVGVDVEALPAPESVDEVGALLHPGERAEILAAAPAARPARFARIWTRKEAYLKGLGVGIATGLAADHVGRTASPLPGWTVLDAPAPGGYAAAAAVAA